VFSSLGLLARVGGSSKMYFHDPMLEQDFGGTIITLGITLVGRIIRIDRITIQIPEIL
jgi:hypothetical protein